MMARPRGSHRKNLHGPTSGQWPCGVCSVPCGRVQSYTDASLSTTRRKVGDALVYHLQAKSTQKCTINGARQTGLSESLAWIGNNEHQTKDLYRAFSARGIRCFMESRSCIPGLVELPRGGLQTCQRHDVRPLVRCRRRRTPTATTTATTTTTTGYAWREPSSEWRPHLFSDADIEITTTTAAAATMGMDHVTVILLLP